MARWRNGKVGEVEGMGVGAKRQSGGMVAGPLRGRGVERQHMSGARVHRGDKMEGMWVERLKL